ncbi:MAG: chemotaxis protein CheB [Campylobacterales bacterium]|nr:chemotaxis protein CheB [Campylobacterales bacterium]
MLRQTTFTQNLKHSALNKVVLIGASTGGPGQIEKIINALPTLHYTSIIIAQHMVKEFIPSFMKRLQENNHNRLCMAEENQKIENGYIYICNGEISVKKEYSDLFFLHQNAPENSYNPNINLLFNSFVPLTKELQIMSVILTGIGDDGVYGCEQLSLHNAQCLTETQESAIVDGMPNRARAVVPNIKVLDINEIVNEIKEFCN